MVPNLDDVTCMATIPDDMEVEAHLLAKEDGIIAGIALVETIFNEVDPSLKVLRPGFKKSVESGTTRLIHNRICDAPKPGGPMTTRQPAEIYMSHVMRPIYV